MTPDRRRPPRRPNPPPMEANEIAPVAAGTACWLVAVAVLAAEHHAMAARGQGWWLWVGVSGVALGFWGLAMVGLRHRSRRRRR